MALPFTWVETALAGEFFALYPNPPPSYCLLSSAPLAEVIEAANATTYSLACSVLTANLSRAFPVAHQLETSFRTLPLFATTCRCLLCLYKSIVFFR